MTEELNKANQDKTWIARLTHALTGEPQNITELLELIQDAANRGLIDENSLKMIEGVLAVQELKVYDVAVPKAQVTFISSKSDLAEIIDIMVKSGHSRFPVFGESKDDILGILLAKDLLALNTPEKQEKFNIKDNLRKAVFIPESKRLDSLLEEFKENRNHIAIVVDEYGSVTGLVTIEDVLEQIVGDIADEHDIVDGSYIIKDDNNGFFIKAITPIEEFNDYFNCLLDDNDIDTIGGFILKHLGYLPKPGEKIELEGFLFKVIKGSSRKLLLLKAIPQNVKENCD